ncbi:hypothetical protein AAG906_003697 [Vitis piasezkii]
MHGLKETQKKLKQQGYAVKPSSAGLGFVPFKPIKILVKTKKTKASTQHITYLIGLKLQLHELQCSLVILSCYSIIKMSLHGRTKKCRPKMISPKLVSQIEIKIVKLIEVGFIRSEEKEWAIHVCVNFRDLNNACPKDDFHYQSLSLWLMQLQVMELYPSWMDHRYNQIRMCYVDDLVVKSRKREDHLRGLRMVFDRLRRYQLMNPLKCAFGVTSGLGFIVRHRGIEVDQSKIATI